MYGEVPPINEESFSNWCGNQTNTSVFAARPQNLQHIQTLVKYARDKKWRVRCAGRKHSWSPLFADEGQMLLYMDQMESDYPNGERILDVLAGVPLEDLKKFELNNKVNLPCNTVLTVVQLVSVVVSGCHGVGWNFQTPADYVTKIRIVNSFGELVTYSTDNMSQLRAVVTSYGLFGVVYDVRITMFPQKNAKVLNTYNTVSEIYYKPENMKTLVEGNQSVEMFWLPFNSFPTSEYNPKNDKIWIRLINQTDVTHVLEPKSYYENQSHWALVTETALNKYTPILNNNPELFTFADWVSFHLIKDELYPEKTIYQEFPNAVHWRPHLEIGVVYDMEFAFDFKGDYGMICRAIQFVMDKVVSYHKIKKYPLNVVLEMRWMAYSDAYMCPAVIGNPKNGGSGHVVYLEILSVIGTEGWEDFCKEIGTEWMKYGGVPHLAKQWSFLPGIDAHIRQMFGSNMVQFLKELKASKADPDGIFQNDRLQELFYSKT
ncbi:hypothetical protein KUTeg_010784 [Tegillarca granosa]|uniref:FAD-binding PCMH-type domain-containing protein n=1 Tax=Tegillarca granosa TaxID=220873 RepID=A0ABQ9F274_TEGGR|nr:hypothetical protein KUTeg_010784 [Tegillarca granosa]